MVKINFGVSFFIGIRNKKSRIFLVKGKNTAWKKVHFIGVQSFMLPCFLVYIIHGTFLDLKEEGRADWQTRQRGQVVLVAQVALAVAGWSPQAGAAV